MKRRCCGIHFEGGDTKKLENIVQCGNFMAGEFHNNTQIFNLLTKLFSNENLPTGDRKDR